MLRYAQCPSPAKITRSGASARRKPPSHPAAQPITAAASDARHPPPHTRSTSCQHYALEPPSLRSLAGAGACAGSAIKPHATLTRRRKAASDTSCAAASSSLQVGGQVEGRDKHMLQGLLACRVSTSCGCTAAGTATCCLQKHRATTAFSPALPLHGPRHSLLPASPPQPQPSLLQ